MKHFLNLSEKDINSFLKSIGEKPYRAKQISRWIYEKNILDFNQMSDLSPALRKKLIGHFFIKSLTVDSTDKSFDGTVRYNVRTSDGYLFPGVAIPSNKRTTLCVSSQIGCPLECEFCASGTDFKRNLTAGEILEQVLIVSKNRGQKPDSVLFMGMGEPLLNYENTIAAIKTINSPSGLNIGSRHITISTIGIVGGIKKLSRENLKIRLALSLHAPFDDLRKKLIPSARDKVENILSVSLEYSGLSRTRLTIEYILIKGVTDTKVCINKLVSLLKKKVRPDDKLQINLIPYNPVSVGVYETPLKEEQEEVKNFLVLSGFFTIIRANRGIDIKSACGQLSV